MDSIDDEQRYEAMYRLAYPVVLRYCQRRLPADTARDVAADVFLVAWRRFDTVPDLALPWLLRTASLTVRGDGRRSDRAARLAAKVASVDPPAAVPDHADAVADRERVRAALAGLSEQDRELLMLTSWDDLDVATAAAVVGCSRAALRVRLHRARKRLANLLVTQPSGAAPAAPALHSVPCLEEPA